MKIQLSGGAYQARSVISSAQRCLNLFAEPLPEIQGEPSRFSYLPTPGLRLLGTLPKGPVRSIKQCTTGGVYAVGGDTVYLVNPNNWTSTALGTIATLRPYPVSMQDNGNTMVIVDGTTHGWTIDLASHAFAAINDEAFYGADRVDYLDTYLLFNKPGTPQFYTSDSLATTFDSLYFANKESFSDLLVTLAVAQRHIWLLGDRTTEIWSNVGAADFPFQQESGTFVQHGCCAKYSVATYDDKVFWLSGSAAGQGIVMFGQNYKTQRISTYAIEVEFTRYPKISDAIGFVYFLGGHAFYVLTFPAADKTWAYDVTTDQWHEWLWIDDNGEEHRHRANCAYSINGMVVAGDWQNGNLYAVEPTAFTDNGQPIKRQRSYPHILNEMDRVYYRQFLADIESGNPAGPPEDSAITLLSCSFTAADGTLLENYGYPADIRATWTLVSGSSGKIEGGRFVGVTGSSAVYRSPTISVPDYMLQFRAIPNSYTNVGTSSVFAIARSSGTGTGYRATVYGDGTQYWVSLGVEGGTSTSLPMGTIPGGWYIVTIDLQRSQITLKVQRNSDNMYLQPSGIWGSAGVPAVTLSDITYSAAGTVMIGGAWSAPPPTLSYTMETPLDSNPDWPIGYSSDLFGTQTFDFTRNLYYAPISASGQVGVSVTDLNTMAVIRTPTLNQMFAGTPFGLPAGSPPHQSIPDLVCGNGTDLYMLTGNSTSGLPDEWCYFFRVDPNTMKVTGQFYISNTVPPPINSIMTSGTSKSAANTTSSRTIVAYLTNAAENKGPQIMDGTGMVPIGMGPTPLHDGYNLMICAGAKLPDGSCDFILLDPDDVTPATGNIDIWRINVSNTLVITSTHTGTLNVLPFFTPTTRLYVGQLDYDEAHDTIMVVATGGFTTNAAPSTLMSVNYNGSVNWHDTRADIGGSVYNKGQYNLTGTTYMAGNSNNLRLYDTGTGAITWTGSIMVEGTSAGSFFHVWDATRDSYWTYALSRGFVRIDRHAASSVAMDNLLVTGLLRHEERLIFLDWSDDRGHAYGNPVGQPIGARGAYLTSVQWQRLAYARDRVFRLTWSVPVSTALQGAFIEVDTNPKS